MNEKEDIVDKIFESRLFWILIIVYIVQGILVCVFVN